MDNQWVVILMAKSGFVQVFGPFATHSEAADWAHTEGDKIMQPIHKWVQALLEPVYTDLG